MIPIFQTRRNRFFEQMRPNSIAILFSAPRQMRTHSAYYPYRQDNNFYYLTGFTEPEAIAVWIKTKTKRRYILFNQPRNATTEKWSGPIIGQEKAISDFGADKSYPTPLFANLFSKLAKGKKYLYYAHKCHANLDYPTSNWMKTVHQTLLDHSKMFDETLDITDILNEMRLIKTKEEIHAIKKAIEITGKAFIAIMKQCQAGMYEYQIAAKLMHAFYHHNTCEAFPAVVASGINACTIHHEYRNTRLKKNDLLLVDAGCEYQYYSADVSRTFPVSGRFTAPQRSLYELVLKAQQAVIDHIKPGNHFHAGQEIAIRVITEGLCQLNILSGHIDTLIRKEAYKPFYMHQVSHWIGMDTHDVGAYKINDAWRPLQPGMVLSVEPGIYIPPDMKGIDKKWRGIGIRIEDDVLVTRKGCNILTTHIPKTVQAIEQLMNQEK